MTFVSLTQAAQQLGIDGKTLRRWLAQAQVAVVAPPSDHRLKALTPPQLRQLAQQHHRQLAVLDPEPAPRRQGSVPAPLDPAAVLDALHELHAQMAALHGQVSRLAAQLQAIPAPVPAAAALTAPALPPPAAQPSPPPSRVAVIPRVEYAGEGHYVLICPTHGVLPFEPDSREWVGWLASQTAFRFVGQAGRLTAHREVDRLHPRPWRAHRKLRHRTHNLPLAHGEHLTIAVLEQAAATFQAQLG